LFVVFIVFHLTRNAQQAENTEVSTAFAKLRILYRQLRCTFAYNLGYSKMKTTSAVVSYQSCTLTARYLLIRSTRSRSLIKGITRRSKYMIVVRFVSRFGFEKNRNRPVRITNTLTQIRDVYGVFIIIYRRAYVTFCHSDIIG